MAGALARLSGRPGLCLSIKGPGVANLMAGLATCRLENLPVIAVSEAYGVNDILLRQHKRMDHAGFARSSCKRHIGLPAGPGVIDSLIDSATAEIPGPVFLELAATDTNREDAPLVSASPQDSERTLRIVEAAERPIIIVGCLATRLDLFDQLSALRFPVFTTAAAKGSVDESMPCSAGVFTGAGLDLAPESTILPESDLVIGIGMRPAEVLALDKIPCGIVGIDAIPPCAPNLFNAFASPSLLPALWDILSTRRWGLDLVQESQVALREHLLSMPFLPAHCFVGLDQYFDGDYRIVLDTGAFCTVGEHLCRVREPMNYLSSGMARSMGASLPMAVAASIHDASKPTVLAVGDGGIGMYIADLKLAVAANSPLLVILFSDSAFGSIRAAAKLAGLTEKPLKIAQPGWCRVGEGMGLWCAEAVNQNEFCQALSSWSPEVGPGLIEVHFPADPYRDMTRNLRG